MSSMDHLMSSIMNSITGMRHRGMHNGGLNIIVVSQSWMYHTRIHSVMYRMMRSVMDRVMHSVVYWMIGNVCHGRL